MSRSIKVRIIKETSNTVTVYMLGLNRKMPVPKAEFDERIASGLYEIVERKSAKPAAEEETPAEDAPKSE